MSSAIAEVNVQSIRGSQSDTQREADLRTGRAALAGKGQDAVRCRSVGLGMEVEAAVCDDGVVPVAGPQWLHRVQGVNPIEAERSWEYETSPSLQSKSNPGQAPRVAVHGPRLWLAPGASDGPKFVVSQSVQSVSVTATAMGRHDEGQFQLGDRRYMP